MGKADKVTAGRVPLVAGSNPLLYPRYNSIEELLKIGKAASEAPKEPGDGERPNKKQKRSVAAATVDAPADGEEAPVAAPSKFAVVDEDGLTYKQRRQLRRAEERAAKAVVDAAAAAAKAANAAAAAEAAAASGTMAEDGEVAVAVMTEAAVEALGVEVEVAERGKETKKDKKDKKKDKRARDTAAVEGAASGPVAAAAPAAAVVAQGNADEAARMRAVLGFTGATTGPAGAGGVSLAAVVAAAPAPEVTTVAAPAAAAPAAAPEPAGGAEADGGVEGSIKKRKKDKKAKKEAGAATEQQEGKQEAEQQPEGQKEVAKQEAAAGASGRVDGAAAGTEAGPGSTKTGSKAVRGSNAAAAASKQFSFEFKVQAEVEAATEAKLARIMAIDSTKDGLVPRRVWVTGLPHEYDGEQIREYWGYCGEVEDMHFLAFADTGNFNGTAFITFKTQTGYEAALACNGEMLEGRALRVEKCKAAAELKGKARTSAAAAAAPPALPVTDAPAAAAPAAAPASQTGAAVAAVVNADGRTAGYPVAYVGNVSFEAGAEELQALFAGAGAVPTKVRLHTDKATGRSKGFAHVHFATDADVDKAVGLEGTAFHGRKIRVSYAQPKPGDMA